MSERFTLATIGSMTLSADATDGRLDLYMKSDHQLSDEDKPRQLGLTLMFDDLELFETQVRAAVRATKRRRK